MKKQNKKKIRIGVAVRVRPFLGFEKDNGWKNKIMKFDMRHQ